MNNLATNKGVWIAAGLIVVVLIVFFAMQGGGTGTAGETQGTEDVSSGSVNAGSQTAALTYQQALKKYADHRIQFTGAYSGCQANPSQVTYKDNKVAYFLVKAYNFVAAVWQFFYED